MDRAPTRNAHREIIAASPAWLGPAPSPTTADLSFALLMEHTWSQSARVFAPAKPQALTKTPGSPNATH
eukprot:923150-Alexandrium_andersonii.AAC.1